MFQSPGSVQQGGVLLLTAVALGACASASPSGGTADTPTPTPSTTAASTDSLPPAGYGTLRQDDFTLAFAADGVQLKVTPLAERIIRLAAPDTYQRLHAMVNSRESRIDDITQSKGIRGTPRVFLVSFFTFQRQARFTPTDFQILSQGMLYRPIGIIPLTPGWGQEQLMQQETQSALYVFDPGIDLDVTMQVEYANAGTSAWGNIVSVLEAERGRVISRSKS